MPVPDLTTQRFGRFTVTRLTDKRTSRRNAIWECICDCGNIRLIPTNLLTSKSHCGCNKRARSQIDMRGQRIGRLLVGACYTGGIPKGSLWECLCDCGNIIYVSGSHLRAGQTKSCGCLIREIMAVNIRKAIAARTKSDEEADMRYLLTSYKQAAKVRGLCWELPIERFRWLIKQDCSYCGIPPYQARNAERYRNTPYNGIDRVINSLGYTLENSVPCCGVCNKAKHTRNADEFREWILRAALHLNKQSGSNVDTCVAHAVV